jgi:hypothetical protein
LKASTGSVGSLEVMVHQCQVRHLFNVSAVGKKFNKDR